MKQTTIKLEVREITYENGTTEITILTPQQWAGRKRRKGYKKTIITNKTHATISINIKQKQ